MPANTRNAGQSRARGREKKSAVALGRNPNGKFKKGVSGNPHGRPLVVFELREAAREHAPAALTKLVSWMNSPDPQYSIQACKILLDRAYGKAIQHLAGNGNTPAINLNFGAAPITTAEEAMRAYKAVMGDSSLDTRQLQFSPAKKEVIKK